MNLSYKNHYQILGVGPEAGLSRIKSAFRRLSLKHHPDKNRNSEDSTVLYRLIVDAYRILSDEKAKEEYDEFLQRSRYAGNSGQTAARSITGSSGISKTVCLDRVNLTLWEIDDILHDRRRNDPDAVRKPILLILTFLDKWILHPYGFPDYFMEARQRRRIDPREYINLLSTERPRTAHLPYNSLEEYFYDVRKRADKFLQKYGNQTGWGDKTADHPIGLPDRLIEYHNMAVHYLSFIIHGEERTDREIPPYSSPYEEFNDQG